MVPLLSASFCLSCTLIPLLVCGTLGLSHNNVPMAAVGLLIILTDGNGSSSGSYWGSGGCPRPPSVQSPGSVFLHLQGYGHATVLECRNSPLHLGQAGAVLSMPGWTDRACPQALPGLFCTGAKQESVSVLWFGLYVSFQRESFYYHTTAHITEQSCT